MLVSIECYLPTEL